MESLLPTYPSLFTSSQETSQDHLYPRETHKNGPSAADPSPSDASHLPPPTALAAELVARPSSDPQQHSRSPTQTHHHHFPLPHSHSHPEPHLYSPTRAEIEEHPIRQRLSLERDEVVTGYGTAREATSETSETAGEVGEVLLGDNNRQAHEGSERFLDAMSSEASNVKEGDAGECVFVLFFCARVWGVRCACDAQIWCLRCRCFEFCLVI